MNSEITRLISTGQVELALQKMLADYPIAIQLSAQYHAAKNDNISGVLNIDEWSRARAKITSAMLEVLRTTQTSQPVRSMVENISSQPITLSSLNSFSMAAEALKKLTLKVFLSYAHLDEDLKNELKMHLSGLRRAGKIEVWQDRAITPGSEYDAVIKKELAEADLILLLVSAAFMDSDYIWRVEIEHAMARHAAKSAVVVPIIIKPCEWKDMPFAKLQVLPRDGKPVTSYTDKDLALAEIAKSIRGVVENLTST